MRNSTIRDFLQRKKNRDIQHVKHVLLGKKKDDMLPFQYYKYIRPKLESQIKIIGKEKWHLYFSQGRYMIKPHSW